MTTAVFSVGAFADDPVNPASQYAAQAFDQLKSQVTSYNGYAWPLAVLVVGSLIGIKLFKKFANKAS
ncbi:TPA: phage coat protein [Klebsiella oxytoca]|uniref:Phage coat protein n=1 Tax=Klebsiella oxytoca TaxID=571 RepID=A0AAN5RGT0_KLEOX|nr:phage coat protein [Klebsiella oxytoca]